MQVYYENRETKMDWKKRAAGATIESVLTGETHVKIADHIIDAGLASWKEAGRWMDNTDVNILESIFSNMNHDHYNPLSYYHPCQEGGYQFWVRENGVHTSFSVGDVVEVDGRFYQCADRGWNKLA